MARGELHKIENLFRNTFDQAPIGVAFANPQGRFLRFNAAFRTLLGYAPEELSDLSIPDLTHPEDRAEFPGRTRRMSGSAGVCSTLSPC